MRDTGDTEKAFGDVHVQQGSPSSSSVCDDSARASFNEKTEFDEKTRIDIKETGIPSQQALGAVEDLPGRLGSTIGVALGITEKEIEDMFSLIEEMTVEEARQIIEDMVVYHDTDRNMTPRAYNMLKDLVSDVDIEPSFTAYDRDFALRTVATIMHHHSPYPEVRAVTSFTDEYEEVCETPRSYILGFIWVMVGSGVNQFFGPRNPPISLPAALFQLLILPCGWIWARIMPEYDFDVPALKIKGREIIRSSKFRWNPGPWTKKEQMFVTIMFNVTASTAYVHYNIMVQKLPMFYGNKWVSAGFQICLVLSTQCMGFALAGLMRSILVYPVHTIWMTNFPVMALNRALMAPEKKEKIHGWAMTRYKFFCVIFIAVFFYQWLPSYLMTCLSTFNWMTWIKQDNLDLANITGSIGGMGINPVTTFDWTLIQIFTPLVTPFYAQVGQYLGALLACAVLVPAIYYSNVYYSGYLPINSNKLFTNTGERYNVTAILSGNSEFDAKKYQEYSPPYYSAGNLVVYGAFFAGYTCIFVRSLLYDWRTMYEGFAETYKMFIGKGKGIKGFNDGQSRMMHRYEEAPFYWYLAIVLISIVLGIVSIECYPTTTPVWGMFLGLGLGIAFLVPIGMLYARTSVMFSLNVLTELIAGYALPGRGIALMMIKAFGLNINYQAINFMADLKLGHYAKIPPRATFRAQLTATVWAAFVVLGVINWQISNVDDICSPTLINSSKFTCPGENTYFAASVQWGTIGPKRTFWTYPILKWCFLIGCGIPIPFYLVDRFYPNLRRYTRFCEPNLMIMGMLNYLAPYNLSYATMGLYVGAFFMHYIRHKKLAWFEKYNYILSAALSAGSAISVVIIFFAVQYNDKPTNWWGNTKPYSGIDAAGGQGNKEIPKVGYFGPAPGSYYLG